MEPKILVEKKDIKIGKVTNLVIKSNEARLSGIKAIKPKKGIEAIPAVKAVPEVVGIKDPKTGKVTTKHVPAIKAKAGKEGRDAVPGFVTVRLLAKTREVADEVIARMKDQGYTPMSIEAGKSGYDFAAKYKVDMASDNTATSSIKPIRAAFKKAKSPAGYNKAGLDALKATQKEELAKKKADAKAKKDAEKKAAKDKKVAEKKTTEKKTAEKKTTEKKNGKSWPSNKDKDGGFDA
ncbi:MAG: hypothetical protein GY861_24280 [bacterium]|nr:hypothetical protein [bacterium]